MVLYSATPQYYTIDATGTASAAITLPTAVKSELLTSQETDGSWWAVGSNGIHKVTIDGTTATTEVDYQKINASTVSRVFYLVYNEEKDYLLAANTGPILITKEGGNAIINRLENGIWTTLDTKVTAGGASTATVLQRSYLPIFDPKDSNAFIIGTRDQGIFRFVDNPEEGFKEANHWTQNNSPVYSSGSRCNAHAIDFDRNGNIWFISGTQKPSKPYILPHDKIDVETPSANDWVYTELSFNYSDQWENIFYIARKSGVKIYCPKGYANVFFFKEKVEGDYSSFNLAEFKTSSSTLDQDGNIFSWDRIFSFAEDLNGKVWMGSTTGICVWNPENIFDTDSRVYRPKVPRNDGTNNADYLLDGVSVTCIAVDALNRKWIGTNANGVFLVSADGTEIIEQLNTSNSVLPTDQILSICVKPNSNTIFIGTPNGVLEYETSSVTPAPSYDEVLVYPNPVRPEYTGFISIKGLMANSLVKISDASGNVITSLQATGGTATWDGLNASGERVKSGVYYVLASENENETSSAIVAKFLVIR